MGNGLIMPYPAAKVTRSLPLQEPQHENDQTTHYLMTQLHIRGFGTVNERVGFIFSSFLFYDLCLPCIPPSHLAASSYELGTSPAVSLPRFYPAPQEHL